jgi:glutathione S-transferase
VVLATAMQQGLAPWRLGQLRAELGVSRQTLVRWRTWWAETFTGSAFWKAAKAAFMPAISGAVPHALIERFAGDTVAQVVALMHLLSPLSTPPDYLADRRR